MMKSMLRRVLSQSHMKQFHMEVVQNNTFSMKVMFLLPLQILARDSLKGEGRGERTRFSFDRGIR